MSRPGLVIRRGSNVYVDLAMLIEDLGIDAEPAAAYSISISFAGHDCQIGGRYAITAIAADSLARRAAVEGHTSEDACRKIHRLLRASGAALAPLPRGEIQLAHEVYGYGDDDA